MSESDEHHICSFCDAQIPAKEGKWVMGPSTVFRGTAFHSCTPCAVYLNAPCYEQEPEDE